MANASPQHTPTDGLGTLTQITLSGTGVTQVAGNVYKVTLSLAGTNSVVLTAGLKDVGGNAFTSGNSNTTTWKSYNTAQATVSAGTVTAVAVGQAIVEARFPTFDVDATKDASDFVYAQVIVTVTV